MTRSIENIAREFPILMRPLPSGQRPVFLDSGASAQKPQFVIDKQCEVEQQYYANAFRGRYYFGQRVDDEIESTRAHVASLIGAERTDEIVFTSGTTMSINMVARSWGHKFVQSGDEIVITEMEHHANFVPWQILAKERNATLRIWPITDDGQLDPSQLDSIINDKTAIVAICSMSNVLGTLNPVDQICQRAHQCGAVVLVDAAQSVPHMVSDVAKQNIDFLTFSGHKLYGPTGVGVLYGRAELLEAMDPFLYGGHMISRVRRESSTWAQPPAKFESGTMPIVQIIGLGAAIDFVRSVGFDAISKHEHRLVAAIHDRLSRIDGLTIYGPDLDKKGAIVSFSIDGVSTEDLAIRLDQRGVFTRHGHHCAMVLHERLGVAATTRASLGMYNTMADVDELADAIDEGVKEIRGV
ncbi:MAG: cysteine desulfurase [Pirellulaceae bacterium]|nr:cysteine desulfurase [Pirellulaceae bacterium]